MRAPNPVVLFGLAFLCVALLGGCSGSSSNTAANSAATPVTAAEANVGASYLPPDGAVAAASTLSNDDLTPGDANATTSVDSTDLPPT